ncbi:hypothetical protein KTD18_16025 [Burkholderia multivorans]|uniref:hypothetical protein n=1 Tax=Burkholderia multivorans TaxID=87883 RepID=UPI001C247BA1|nr:hypothetical protein [Burkholderia multivorans]MBU9293056.1 hypothetical protein [Burkholderia multivorans]
MKTFLAWLVAIGVVGGCTYDAIFSERAKQELARNQAQERADATPHVIREADGCKVYAFEADGRWHYFTRCGDGTVTTERNWTERHGKTTEHKSETIVTEER